MPLTHPPGLPRPSWDDLSARSELSTARQRVLEEVETAHQPLKATEVAERLGLHHNTVREHLDALVEAGFVTTASQSTGRRGRPALLYSSTAPDPGEVLDSYLALLDAVAETLGSGEQAQRTAKEIGRRWAAGMQADPTTDHGSSSTSAPSSSSATTLDELVPELSVMGFAPEVHDEAIILKACPLITGRRVPHELVCLMHEGFLEASVHGTDDAGPQVLPCGCPASETGTAQAASLSPHAGASSDGGEEGSDAAGRPLAHPGCRGCLTVTPLLPDGCHITLAHPRSGHLAP